MNFWMILMILSMPWRPEYVPTILSMGVVEHEAPCYFNGIEYAGWVGADNKIHLCPSSHCFRKDLLLLHETQHLLTRLYLGNVSPRSWQGFETLTMRSLYAHDYGVSATLPASTVLGWKQPGELHAELPLLVGPDSPDELQGWYPWFDLSDSRVATSQENAAWPIDHRHRRALVDVHRLPLLKGEVEPVFNPWF